MYDVGHDCVHACVRLCDVCVFTVFVRITDGNCSTRPPRRGEILWARNVTMIAFTECRRQMFARAATWEISKALAALPRLICTCAPRLHACPLTCSRIDKKKMIDGCNNGLSFSVHMHLAH